MVGRPWNARKNPRDSSPWGFFCPGGRASLPNRNSAPAVAESSTFITTSFTYKKTFVPAGT